MALTEAETRTLLIDPALHARGWTEDLIKREETLGTIEIVAGRPRRQTHDRTDYTLRIKVATDAQPVAVAIIEAKSEDKHPAYFEARLAAIDRTRAGIDAELEALGALPTALLRRAFEG